MDEKLFKLALTNKECALLSILVVGGVTFLSITDIESRVKVGDLADRVINECERVIAS